MAVFVFPERVACGYRTKLEQEADFNMPGRVAGR